RLGAGKHSVRLTRAGGDLHPGDGDAQDVSSGLIGSLAFALERPQDGTVLIAPGKDVASICSAYAGYQWIEVLTPGSQSSRHTIGARP
ncbi:MAG TPA: hypothetical protein VGI27_11805, partial [Solirubrobacteraceae bacterium]